MPIRERRRRRLFWPYCHFGPWGHGPYGPPPPPPWWTQRWSREDEREHLEEYIAMLKEEIEEAEHYLEEIEKQE
jgi:hypothetical protein